jgi:hypothetical protein
MENKKSRQEILLEEINTVLELIEECRKQKRDSEDLREELTRLVVELDRITRQ